MRYLTIFLIILFCFSAACKGANMSKFSKTKRIVLSEPNLAGPLTLEEALSKRRSIRRFSGRPLDLDQIGQLAWAGQGITEKTKGFRTSPSAGAIYPITLYFATAEGLFEYLPADHSLEKISATDIRSGLSAAALGQSAVAGAACDIIIAGSERKLAAKYRSRAQRYMLLEAGHIAQNILLQAASLDLGSVPIGAFDIKRVGSICRLPAKLEAIYIISVGYPYQSDKKEREAEKMIETNSPQAVLIIASKDFRDEELFDTQAELEKAGIETVIASSKIGSVTGMLGRKARAEILLSNLKADDYDAVIFIGGIGAKEYFHNDQAMSLARDAAGKRKIVGAICIAPAILANAGLLDGINATCFSSEKATLKKAGAEYTASDVECDGLFITADGPGSAREFGKTIAATITEQTKKQ